MKIRVTGEKYLRRDDKGLWGVLEVTTEIIPESEVEKDFIAKNMEELEYRLKPIELGNLMDWSVWKDNETGGIVLWEEWEIHPEADREKVKEEVDKRIHKAKKVIAQTYHDSLCFTIVRETPVDFPPEVEGE